MHDETLILPIHEHLQLHASQYKQKTQHPSHPLHKHTTYFNTPRLKHYFDNDCYTKTFPQTPTQSLQHHKNKHAQYIALKRYFRVSLVAPNQNNLNHTYTKSTPKTHHHYAPFVTPTYAPHCHPWIYGQTLLVCLRCWPDVWKSWVVDHTREDRNRPISKVQGNG